MAVLRQSTGLLASGKIALRGPNGRFSARLVFGVARPDSLRIEIPAGTGLRFLLVAKDGKLRADLPQDDAMFEGPSNMEVMNRLFGIDLAPQDLVSAILGTPTEALKVGWRFDRRLPRQITMQRENRTRLTLSLDDPELESPRPEAFDFGGPRRHSISLAEMSDRLGLRR